MQTLFVQYLRTSTAKKDQKINGYSFAAQECAIRNYVANVAGGEIIGTFSDQESGANNERIGLQKAMVMARERGATIVISKLDRLSRSAAFIIELCDKNVPFKIAEMPEATPFAISIYACLAQQERLQISQRVKSSMAAAKRQGRKFGTKTPIEAVKAMNAGARAAKEAHKAVILPVVQEIWAAGVHGLQNTCDCLNRRGFFTRRNNKWTPASLRLYVA